MSPQFKDISFIIHYFPYVDPPLGQEILFPVTILIWISKTATQKWNSETWFILNECVFLFKPAWYNEETEAQRGLGT